MVEQTGASGCFCNHVAISALSLRPRSLPHTAHHLGLLFVSWNPGLLQRATVRVTRLHPGLAPGRPGASLGAPGAGIGRGPTPRPCLPRSPAPRPLRLSCPPAPPRRPSRRSRCPRCVSAPPSLAAGAGKRTVSAALPPQLPAGPRKMDDPHPGPPPSPCKVNSVTVKTGLSGATVSPARSTGCRVRARKYSPTDCISSHTHFPDSATLCRMGL